MNADILFADVEMTPITYDDARKALTRCNSYTRLPELLSMEWMMDSADFLRLLGEEWAGFDNIGSYIDELTFDSQMGHLIAAGQLPIREMTTPDEQAAYEALPDVVTVYRGCYAANKWGFSWSLDKAVAERFPTLNRYRREGEQAMLVTAKAKKADIIAVKLDREEAEIITHRPKCISTSHIKGFDGGRAMFAGV